MNTKTQPVASERAALIAELEEAAKFCDGVDMREFASRFRRAAALLSSDAKPASYTQGWKDGCKHGAWAAKPASEPISDPLWPVDGPYPDMQPPATSRDRWMFDQGRLAERRIAASEPVAVPLGWRLVPVEPTDAMRDAGNEVILDRGKLFRAWSAMLNAAPVGINGLTEAETNASASVMGLVKKENE